MFVEAKIIRYHTNMPKAVIINAVAKRMTAAYSNCHPTPMIMSNISKIVRGDRLHAYSIYHHVEYI